MTRDFYAEPGLNVEVYTLRTALSPVVAGDVEFYRELAVAAPGPALELGCGTGRVLLPLARSGITITGLDLSSAMLEVAAARLQKEPEDVRDRATLMMGDMSSFALERRFGLVFIAFRSFQMLTRPEDQRACLECVFAHLVPGGRVAINLFDPLFDQLSPEVDQIEPRYLGNAPHPITNNLVKVETVSKKNDPVRQLSEEVWRFTEIVAGGAVVRQEEETLRIAWIFRREMRYLLELCGFEVEAEYSDYVKSPPAYGKEQVWVARKPSV